MRRDQKESDTLLRQRRQEVNDSELEEKQWSRIHIPALCTIVFTIIFILATIQRSKSSFSGSTRQNTSNEFQSGDSRSVLSWGIAGLGRIANDFALTLIENNIALVACAAGSLGGFASRQARAELFASQYQCLPFNSYESLANFSLVNIIYVANTNNLHYSTTLLFLRAGKHVSYINLDFKIS